MVRDAGRLRRNYVRSNKWRWDLLSLLPTDVTYSFWRTADYCGKDALPCPVAVRINRLLRVPRMVEFFDKTETRTGYPNAFRICKVPYRPRNQPKQPRNLFISLTLCI